MPSLDPAIIPILTAAISFVAAVVAVVVGQLIGQRFQRQADERRWMHEDEARRRLRGEECAREARKALTQAAAMFDSAWREAGYDSARWEYPRRSDIERLVNRALDVAIEIPSDEIQIFVRTASFVLLHADDANQGGSLQPWLLGRAVAGETDAVIGAYIRGTSIPKAVEVEAAAEAAASWQLETRRR